MTVQSARDRLGCQVWLEPDDAAERVDWLFSQAAESGLGWARLFLMWPWIEEKPGEWNFTVFDLAFAAAARHGVRIKATLTANSGPWWLGTPSMLHSHTGFLSPEQRDPMRRYVRACVERYAHHPALGQWILWNEPNGGAERTPEALVHWQKWLASYYGGDIAALNRRWRTGYVSFDAVQFPEEIPHPVHAGEFWNSYGPWLLDWRSRADWLNQELAWLKDLVREIDAVTPCCVNPTDVLRNQAAGGTDLEAMGRIVEVIGASYHPAWHFTFADRQEFPALMAAGVALEASTPTVACVEVTEVQAGNTVNSSHRPSAVTPAELARFYLAGLAAGAESVTGWCLNVRSRDFEAGDWGLLDNRDQPSPRSRQLRLLHDRLAAAHERTGVWSRRTPRALVGISAAAQAIEWVEAKGAQVDGRRVDDGAHGAALLAAQLMQLGAVTAMAQLCDLPAHAAQPGDAIVLSHVVAWEAADADRLLSFVGSGGVLVIDATCGRKNTDAVLQRPWPGGLAAAIGLQAVDLESRPNGYDLLLDGLPAGRWLLTRLVAELDPAAGWQAWPQLRFALDGGPCVWERPLGLGRIVVARGLLGPSVVHARNVSAARAVLAGAVRAALDPIRPVAGHWAALTLPVQVEHGALTVVLAPDGLERGERPVVLHAPPGVYADLWGGGDVIADAAGELTLPAPDGIALLWRPGESAP